MQSILATLMGAAATIWSTLFTGCLGGRVEHVQAVASAPEHQAVGGAGRGHLIAWAGGLAIGTAPLPLSASAAALYEVDLPGGAALVAAGSQAGSDGGEGTGVGYDCARGWVNGDVSSFFGLLALATPVIMLFGKFP